VPEKMVAEMAELTREAANLRTFAEREAEERKMIVKSIASMRSRFGSDIPLSGETVARFKGFRKAHINRTGDLVLVAITGKAVSRRLDSLSSEEFVSVASDCASRLLEPINKEEGNASKSKRPQLLLRISLAGGRLLIFDWRSYHLSIRNSGGDSEAVRISVKILTRLHRYPPFELLHNGTTDLDLRKFHMLGREESVKVEARCRDRDGREYKGSVRVDLERQHWKELQLESIDDRPGTS
jgi:hypothetical protein